jgi:hypothetical protein
MLREIEQYTASCTRVPTSPFRSREPLPAHQLRGARDRTHAAPSDHHFSSGAPAIVTDPALQCVLDATLRRRLFANRDPSLDSEGLPAYRFDIILRGDGGTPFFVD